jgi:hypothetical protein
MYQAIYEVPFRRVIVSKNGVIESHFREYIGVSRPTTVEEIIAVCEQHPWMQSRPVCEETRGQVFSGCEIVKTRIRMVTAEYVEARVDNYAVDDVAVCDQ